MRTTRDRIRHAISFEIIGLLLVTPLGALAFGMPMHDIGIIALVTATLATLWNYIYNLGFDRFMAWRFRSTHKTVLVRVVHAALFEGGLLVALAPFIAWYLGVGIWHALVMDVSFALFYLAYAFVFNWVYDVAFPVPETANA